MPHYVCSGSCQKVSDDPGVCQNPDCSSYNQPLKECNCSDNKHKEVLENSINPGNPNSSSENKNSEEKEGDQTPLFKEPLMNEGGPNSPSIESEPEYPDYEGYEDEEQKPRRFIIAIVAFTLGFALCYFTIGRQPTDNQQLAEESNEPKTEQQQAGGKIEGEVKSTSENSSEVKAGATEMIDIKTQSPGKTVNILKVAMEKDGWVVIHENRDGEPGVILGAYRFSEGTFNNIEIPLLVAIEQSEDYFAVIHDDDGDKKFNHKIDTPRENAEGSMILTEFNVK